MRVAERKAMRREQSERWLATDGMSVEQWCRLNRMSTSTFYLWLNKFKDEEPETFGPRPAKGWIEVARQGRKDAMALAVAGGDATKGKPAAAAFGEPGAPIRISANGIGIEFPHGADAGDLAAVLRAAMSLLLASG